MMSDSPEKGLPSFADGMFDRLSEKYSEFSGLYLYDHSFDGHNKIWIAVELEFQNGKKNLIRMWGAHDTMLTSKSETLSSGALEKMIIRKMKEGYQPYHDTMGSKRGIQYEQQIEAVIDSALEQIEIKF